jgi:flagellar hook assembly protein FlgD
MLGCRGLAVFAIVLAALCCGCGADRVTDPPDGNANHQDAKGGTTPSSPELPPGFHFPLSAQTVTFRIYDVQGAVVRTIVIDLTAGSHELEWDGLTESGLPAGSGVYLYSLDFSDGSTLAGRMILAR